MCKKIKRFIDVWGYSLLLLGSRAKRVLRTRRPQVQLAACKTLKSQDRCCGAHAQIGIGQPAVEGRMQQAEVEAAAAARGCRRSPDIARLDSHPLSPQDMRDSRAEGQSLQRRLRPGRERAHVLEETMVRARRSTVCRLREGLRGAEALHARKGRL